MESIDFWNKNVIQDLVDYLGGINATASFCNVAVTTVRSWLSGKFLGLVPAFKVLENNDIFTYRELIGYEPQCNPKLIELIAFFGSQTKLANKLGIKPASVSRWLSGKSNISIENAKEIEKITNGVFKVSDLIENPISFYQKDAREFLVKAVLTIPAPKICDELSIPLHELENLIVGRKKIDDQLIEKTYSLLSKYGNSHEFKQFKSD